MAETCDIKAGLKNVLERIELASKNRPDKVKKHKFPITEISTSNFSFKDRFN